MHITAEARTMLLVALETYLKTLESDVLIEKFLDLEDEIANYDPQEDWERFQTAQVNEMILADMDIANNEFFSHAMRAEPDDQFDLEDFLNQPEPAGTPTNAVPTDVNPNGIPLYPRPEVPQYQPEKTKEVEN